MVDSVYVVLENVKKLEDIRAVLPKLKIFSNIFLISNDLPSKFEKIYLIARELSMFLKKYDFCRINLNIVHPFFPNARDYYLRLIDIAKPFNLEGYMHQGKPRLIFLSVLVVDRRRPELAGFLDFLRQNFVVPGVYTKKPIFDKVERLVIQPVCAREVIDTLGYYHIFHDILDKMEYSDDRIIGDCVSSLIIGRDGESHPCFGSYWFGQKSCPGCKYQVLKCLKRHPLSRGVDMGSIHARMAFSYLKKNDFLHASKHLEEALHLYPKPERPNLHFHIGLCQLNLNRYDEAIKSFKKSRKDHNTAFYLGFCHLNKGDYKRAAIYFTRALKLKPDEEDEGHILFYLGLCYKSLGNYRRAIKVLERARTSNDSVEVNNLLGICYFKSKDYQNALKSFKRAVSIDSLSAVNYANICICLKKLGRRGEAVKYCERSLELDPSIDFARNALMELKKSH